MVKGAVALLLLGWSGCAWAQARPTAARLGVLQVGGGFTTANADYEYVDNRIRGLMFYSDFDLRENFGIEVEFHQLNAPAVSAAPSAPIPVLRPGVGAFAKPAISDAGPGQGDVYQRTYEVGGRYVRHYGRTVPYVKGLYGRGVLNFPYNVANISYNMLAAGVGVDVAVHPRIYVRADFEYQYWIRAPGSGLHLSPTLFTIGAAYHFPAGRPRK